MEEKENCTKFPPQFPRARSDIFKLLFVLSDQQSETDLLNLSKAQRS